jgi:hypothetical protein
MDHPTTLTNTLIIYDISGAGLYGFRLTRAYGEKTAAPASGMKKQRIKIQKKKNYRSQHHFTNQYRIYNNWKELEKLQEGSDAFMEVMNAFLSAEKLIEDEEIIETIIGERSHLSSTKFHNKSQHFSHEEPKRLPE